MKEDQAKTFKPVLERMGDSYGVFERITPSRTTNVLTSKPWVPFKIGDMRDGANDYKEWPSKYFD